MINVGGSSPLWVGPTWAGSPGLYKASLVSHGKQASKQCPVMVSASVPALPVCLP